MKYAKISLGSGHRFVSAASKDGTFEVKRWFKENYQGKIDFSKLTKHGGRVHVDGTAGHDKTYCVEFIDLKNPQETIDNWEQCSTILSTNWRTYGSTLYNRISVRRW